MEPLRNNPMDCHFQPGNLICNFKLCTICSSNLHENPITILQAVIKSKLKNTFYFLSEKALFIIEINNLVLAFLFTASFNKHWSAFFGWGDSVTESTYLVQKIIHLLDLKNRKSRALKNFLIGILPTNNIYVAIKTIFQYFSKEHVLAANLLPNFNTERNSLSKCKYSETNLSINKKLSTKFIDNFIKINMQNFRLNSELLGELCGHNIHTRVILFFNNKGEAFINFRFIKNFYLNKFLKLVIVNYEGVFEKIMNKERYHLAGELFLIHLIQTYANTIIQTNSRNITEYLNALSLQCKWSYNPICLKLLKLVANTYHKSINYYFTFRLTNVFSAYSRLLPFIKFETVARFVFLASNSYPKDLSFYFHFSYVHTSNPRRRMILLCVYFFIILYIILNCCYQLIQEYYSRQEYKFLRITHTIDSLLPSVLVLINSDLIKQLITETLNSHTKIKIKSAWVYCLTTIEISAKHSFLINLYLVDAMGAKHVKFYFHYLLKLVISTCSTLVSSILQIKVVQKFSISIKTIIKYKIPSHLMHLTLAALLTIEANKFYLVLSSWLQLELHSSEYIFSYLMTAKVFELPDLLASTICYGIGLFHPRQCCDLADRCSCNKKGLLSTCKKLSTVTGSRLINQEACKIYFISARNFNYLRLRFKLQLRNLKAIAKVPLPLVTSEQNISQNICKKIKAQALKVIKFLYNFVEVSSFGPGTTSTLLLHVYTYRRYSLTGHICHLYFLVNVGSVFLEHKFIHFISKIQKEFINNSGAEDTKNYVNH